jgi:hypothetical protein
MFSARAKVSVVESTLGFAIMRNMHGRDLRRNGMFVALRARKRRSSCSSLTGGSARNVSYLEVLGDTTLDVRVLFTMSSSARLEYAIRT